MLNKKFRIVGFITFIILVLLALYIFVVKNNDTRTLMRECPDAWYVNKMPGSGSKNSEYLVVKGKRAELKDYDIEWIKKNCDITGPQPVY